MTQRLVLIGCSKVKLPQAAPARLLYRGDLFQKSRAWAEMRGARWLVLSAKYGVVEPDTVLEPYDETLASWTKARRAEWDRLVLQQLGLRARVPLLLLAGARYRGWTAGLDVKVPLLGMEIGEQKAWLARELERGAACAS
jgi:hypothetical protein